MLLVRTASESIRAIENSKSAERPLSTENRSNTTKVMLPLPIVIYHKTPSAEHLCDTLIIAYIATHCRNRGMDVSTVAPFQDIFADEILETTLARKMTISIEVAHRYIGGASRQVYRMLLRKDEDKPCLCRLCATGAGNGWMEEGTKCIAIPIRDHSGLGKTRTPFQLLHLFPFSHLKYQ